MALEVHDIRIIIGEQGRDVANQSRAVIGVQAQIDRIGPCIRLTPVDRDDALRMALI